MSRLNIWLFALLLYLLFLGSGAVYIPLFTILIRPLDQGGLNFTSIEVTVVASVTAAAAFFSLMAAHRLEQILVPRQLILAAVLLANGLLTACLACLIQNPPAMTVALYSMPAWISNAVIFGGISFITFGFAVSNNIANAVSSALIMQHLKSNADHFSRIRAAGTLGFISAGLIVGLGLRPVSPEPIWLATAVFLAAALFSVCWLPDTPSLVFYPTPVFGVRRKGRLREIVKHCGISLFLLAVGCAAVARFFEVYANAFLSDTPGLVYPSAVQMLAQSLEVLLLILMPVLLRFWPHGRFLVLGPLAWCLLYVCLAGSSWLGWPWLVLIGLPFQGFNCTFGTAGALLVNSRVPGHMRETAQSLFLCCQSAGALVGSILVGLASTLLGQSATRDWTGFWLVAFVLAAAVAVLSRSSGSSRVGQDSSQDVAI